MAVSSSAAAFSAWPRLSSFLRLILASSRVRDSAFGLSYLLETAFDGDFRVINKPAATQEALVEGGRSVRTKRALLVLARHAGHAWYARLEPRRLDLGKGKRQLCQGSKLDRECHIR